MMKRVVGGFVLVPLALLLVVFALANRQGVTIGFDPISPANPMVPGIGMPLFVVIYLSLILGVILGGLAVWFTQGSNRRDKRHFRREAERLTRELETTRRQNPPPEAADLIETEHIG